jgi:ATP-dependent DNA helicase RecG
MTMIEDQTTEKLYIEEIAGGVQITMFKQDKLISGGNDTLNDTLNDRQAMILKIISSKHGITLPEIAIQVDVGIATVKRDIDFLKEKNIIKRIGSRKSGYWQINLKNQ